MTLSKEDFGQLMWHMADEINVHNIIINGKLVYSRPPLSDRHKKQLEQYSEIYGKPAGKADE